MRRYHVFCNAASTISVQTEDVNSGLIGPIIISRKARAAEDGSPDDIDREFVTLFTVIDENLSWYGHIFSRSKRFIHLRPRFLDDSLAAAMPQLNSTERILLTADPLFQMGNEKVFPIIIPRTWHYDIFMPL